MAWNRALKNHDGRLYRGDPRHAETGGPAGAGGNVSHTAVVWIIAMAGLWFGRGWDAHTSEPWFQLISGVLIVAIALWMAWRTWKESQPHDHHHDHDHHHHHDHDHDHHHDHHHHEHPLVEEEWQDAHQRAHAQDINRRFSGQNVTTGQIVMFGLTGGLIPCPASITVLLICLQLKHFASARRWCSASALVWR
jgi:nickel/cobalt exporter